MLSKKSKYTMIVILLVLLYCKKEDSRSDLTFSQTCDFSSSSVEIVDRLNGSLRYTNNIMNAPASELPVSEYRFFVESPGRLPMAVCNMPTNFEMAEEESRSITFSGRVLVLPEEVDATNTEIELSFLKFE